MDPAFVLMNETQDVEEFLSDVSMHLRRREMKMLLNYIGLSAKDIDLLLYENIPRAWTERGLLTTHGTIVEGSSCVNFMEQRKKSMQTWWEYAANTRQRNTPSTQKLKVVESKSGSLPQIPEDDITVTAEETQTEVPSSEIENTNISFPPILPAPIRKYFEDTGPSNKKQIIDGVTSRENSTVQERGNLLPADQHRQLEEKNLLGEGIEELLHVKPVERVLVTPGRSNTTTPLKTERSQHNPDHETDRTSPIRIIHVPPLTESDSELLSNEHKSLLKTMNESEGSVQGMMDRSQQTDITGCDIPPDQIAIFGSNVTLEELLRKLWKSLQACGLNRVVDDLQQRWLIKVDLNQGSADLYPKMTWGTPLPPQTPFTYPPYKKIGHMAVMGSTMSIETKPVIYQSSDASTRFSKLDSESIITTARSLNLEPAKTSKFMPQSIRDQLRTRSSKSRGPTSVSLDGFPVTAFPTRDSWKLKTDTVRRKGASVTIHVTIEDVTLPAQPSTTWGSSLNVTPQQIRERVARVFISHALQDSRTLCKAVDRIERIRGLVVESASKRIGGGGNAIDITSSELALQCRCLHPQTVEQLWLLYQSGQLRETIQAGLVTKRAQQVCAVDHLLIRVVVAEEEYRRALGLLRRKPMPNTKSGRFYVTSGSGGAVGGAAGIAHAQKQALMSVTRYIKLPDPSPSFEATESIAPLKNASGNKQSTKPKAKISGETPRSKTTGNLVLKVLAKELDAMKERLRMCEDTWCDFAANQFTNMLRCSRHVMQRRIMGATAKNQLTPRCTSLGVFMALYKAIKSPKTNGTVASPRPHQATPIGVNHNSIALYPSDVTFSNVDLVTTVDDDEHVIKARKKEERDFIQGYIVFSNMMAELGACRNILHDKIISRLTTNPTVAPSKHLYLVKDIYNLMERWRHLLVRDFNFANDEGVQRFSSRILSNDIVTTSFDKEIQEQFPGLVGLLPMMFHIAEQIMHKIREILQRPGSRAAPSMYPSISTPRMGPVYSRHLSLWLSA